MKIAIALILLALTGCATMNSACGPDDRKPASDGTCQHSEQGAHYAPAIDPSIRF